jgi:hypothetical protein
MVGQFIFSPINRMVPCIWVINKEQMKVGMIWLLYMRENIFGILMINYIKAEAELSHRSLLQQQLEHF